MTRCMTVSQLASYLKGVFDDEELLHDVKLSGEVVDVSFSDKHTFIVLADGDFSVKCMHFAARDPLEKGMRVELVGSVRFYDKRSSVGFSYVSYELCGAGLKNAELAKLKESLQARGLFENRPQLPKYIFDVVALTSPDGAAIRDLLRVVHDRCPFIRVRVCPVKVQGDGAAQKMADAVKKLQREKTDAIVLCRGGGSDEDLGCFNDGDLAVAVAESKIPVISAVGHEIDYTLCDYCAGTRAGTPSIAGQIIAAHGTAFLNDLYSLATAARAALDKKLSERSARLARLGLRLSASAELNNSEKIRQVHLASTRAYYAVSKRYMLDKNRLTEVAKAPLAALQRRYESKCRRVEKLTAVLNALDPNRIRSGYAAVVKAGKRVESVSELCSGDKVSLRFADGAATAVVDVIGG